MGSCTAGGAYVPAMSDETVIVREQGTIFLGGPPLVKAATGEEVTAEELGGGDVHARTSGVVDHLADDDEHALEIVRGIVATLPAPARAAVGAARRRGRPPSDPDDDPRRRPARPAHALRRRASCCARIVDGGELHEFKELYGTTVVCAFAHLDGHPVGIIANNGILFSESRAEGRALHRAVRPPRHPAAVPAEHLRLHGRPRVRGGRHRQGRRQARHRGRRARACPKLTVIVGGSFGAGNYGMCGRAYSPRFLFMWPNARISVMGGEQAGDRHDRGRPARDRRRGCASSTSTRARPCYSTARHLGRRRHRPARHARVLARALAACAHAPLGELGYGVFRM